MKLSSGLTLTIVVGLGLITFQPAVLAASLYSFEVIGGVGNQGDKASFGNIGLGGAFDINDSGEVVGRFLVPSTSGPATPQAFSTTGTSNLGLPGSQAFAINNQGVVVGQQGPNAFQTTPGGQISQAATIDEKALIGFGINDNADVVGLGTNNQAFRKFAGQPLNNLGTLRSDGTGQSVAYDINRSGVTVGRAAVANPSDPSESYQHAFRYGVDRDILSFSSTIFDLGTLGGNNSLARGINDLGLIVGDSEIQPGQSIRHAFVTLAGITPDSDLGTLCTNDSACNSRAFDINNRLQIVGLSDTEGKERHAFFLDTFDSEIRDLNDLIPKEDSLFFRLEEAYAINEPGQIVGSAVLKLDKDVTYASGRTIRGTAGNRFAFRLTPIKSSTSVPEPTSVFGMLALGALSITSWLKRSQRFSS